MFKLFVAVAILAVAFAEPAPEAKAKPKPEADPTILSYSSPIISAGAAPVVYSSDYSAPLAYAAAPLAYSYSAYPAYSSPYVAVL